MLKLKLVAVLIASMVRPIPPGSKLLYGPDSTGHYSSLGEGSIPTHDCTVTAQGMRAIYDGKHLTFLDRNGQEEGTCQVGERPIVKVWHGIIQRSIGTVGR